MKSAQAVLTAWLRTIDRNELRQQPLEDTTLTVIMADPREAFSFPSLLGRYFKGGKLRISVLFLATNHSSFFEPMTTQRRP